jgi:hypothetical protein
MSTLRVNKITNVNGTGPVEFTKGVNFPSNVSFADTTTSSTSIGIAISSPTGIMIATSLYASDINSSGVVTATSLTSTSNSAGLRLTSVPGYPTAKAISLILIS